MLSTEQIENNKIEFLNLIQSITREGAEIERLCKKLVNSDFFIAPASTKYHGSYAGGLCEHSLNVYYNMRNIVNLKHTFDECCYDEDTLKIVGLLHDISKMNIYEQTSKNVKVYNPEGSRYDDLGNFDWKTENGYKIREHKFVYGSHEMNSEYIVRQFIPLSLDESVAILHHMGSMSWDSAKDNIGDVFNQYSLALLVYMADMMSTYIDERNFD